MNCQEIHYIHSCSISSVIEKNSNPHGFVSLNMNILYEIISHRIVHELTDIVSIIQQPYIELLIFFINNIEC